MPGNGPIGIPFLSLGLSPMVIFAVRGIAGFAWSSTGQTCQFFEGILSQVLFSCFKLCSCISQGSEDTPHLHPVSNPESMTIMYFLGVGHCLHLGEPMAFGMLSRKDQAFARVDDYHI